MSERACAEYVMVNGVKLVCGEAESLHTPEAARGDVGMDHKFVPATWNAPDPKNSLWVTLLSRASGLLWKCGFEKLSWLTADFRFWLHDKGFR